jgi:hypothetical protein
VHLVYYSCRHDCQELLNDFEAANGYQVVKAAILESKSMHGKKLLELLPMLATCQRTIESDDENKEITIESPKDPKLASNLSAFTMIEELAYEAVPMLKMYVEENDGKKPEITTDEQSIRDLASYSLEVATKTRFSSPSSHSKKQSDTSK